MTKRRLLPVAPLFVPLLAVACASPADVQADHDRTLRGYQDTIREAQGNVRHENVRFRGDMATAEDWNHHWLGIPAAGWVAIICVTAFVLMIVLTLCFVLTHERRVVRRRREYDLALERERTEQKRLDVLEDRVQRGNCQVCGGAPVPDSVIEEVNRDRDDRTAR